jgi:tetratricopeptide (TPR) repeat protein
MRAWNADKPACQVEVAQLYTRIFPKEYAGWLALADALGHLARYDEAQTALCRAQQVAPSDRRTDIYIQSGHLHKNKCDLKNAERWYRRAVKHKETAGRLIFLGAVLAKQGRFAEAKRCYRRAIRVATEPPDEAYFNLGLIFRAERKYEDALKNFNQALKIDPAYKLAKEACEDVLEVRKQHD